MSDAAVKRSFILGLDGVPWNLLSQWADSGDLPNVKQLMESGASGPLESTMPPTTAVAWPSIATGVRADKHGVYAFRGLNADYSREINTSNTLREPPIWEITSPALVANVPMTYPASPIDGKMVTGMMTPRRDDGFTYPPEFNDEIDRVVPDYEVGLAWHEYHGQEESFLSDLEGMVEARRALMQHLMEEEHWSLFFFVYTAPDRLQHLIWDHDVILAHYQLLDEIIGEVIEYVEEREANLFVVSDHGFGPVDETIYLNRLLEEAGYLTRKEDAGTRGALGRLGLHKDAIRDTLQQMGLERPLLSIIPSTILDDLAMRIPGEHGMYDVDFEQTKAFAYSGRSVYVNDGLRFERGTVAPAARDGFKQEVRALLETAIHPDTAEPLLEVHDGSNLFPTDPQAPDLVVDSPPGTEVRSSLAPTLVAPTHDRAAGHRRTGILLAYGPNISPGTKIENATVYDVVPTVLQGQQVPIPRDVDGKILNIFDEGSLPATESPNTASYRRGRQVKDHASDFDDVEDRLRGLGYLE